ncbi:hypothetical protein KFK09_029339 [Dendrobium nobile]|uniref:FAD/NAD(P)-binding domain-containing protein n=1 Tax=Dendrobium nobile TaxID=94219 RepID=A0A8T3A194_DENNO|nr:hypothetical protein KFK09_029339 [Dendrobium nobile]
MRFTAFSNKAARMVRHPGFYKFDVLIAIRGGGVVAYVDSRSDPSSEYAHAGPKKKLVVLGIGCAGTSFLKNLDTSLYDVWVISPRNFFTFTPLLPRVICGIVEPRSIVEPIRNIMRKKTRPIQFFEAECYNIDPTNKKVLCRSTIGTNLDVNGEFELDYDYLVVSLGTRPNTFNTPGVSEHCHFLKEYQTLIRIINVWEEIEDAHRIRRSVMNCFERASLPNLSEEERKKSLHFVVISGGPTGVEFLYHNAVELVKMSLIEAGEHILTMFDKKITQFTEEKFQWDGIDVKTSIKVVKVHGDSITKTNSSTGEVNIPYGMAIWSTSFGTRLIILGFMKQFDLGNLRVLETDEWLRVLGCENIYALGDCSIIAQQKVMGCGQSYYDTLTVKEIKDVLEDIERYPQVALYLKTTQMKYFLDLLKEFKKDHSQVDSQVKMLPALAQVAAQEGEYLAKCFNKMKFCEENLEGPIRIRGEGRHHFKPIRWKRDEGGGLLPPPVELLSRVCQFSQHRHNITALPKNHLILKVKIWKLLFRLAPTWLYSQEGYSTGSTHT